MRSLIALGLLVTLQCCVLSVRSDDDSGKCALLIPGHTTSTCISYDAINRAFGAAKEITRLGGPQSKSKELSDIEIDHLGRTLVETSRILAKEFKLAPDAIHMGLPMIDTRHTAIEAYCPVKFQRPQCKVQRYREADGMCNNLENPHWGAVMAPFRRLLPPNFQDGVNAPRVSASGAELPTARLVSSLTHKDLGFHDHAVCNVPANQRHQACWPIDIPNADPFYKLFRRTCLDFVRSGYGVKEQCKLGTRIAVNTVSAYLDASFVYGTDSEMMNKLRVFKAGQMKSNAMNRHKGMKDLLPPQMENPDANCKRPNKDVHCFMAGDARVNQQMMLVALHTIMMREHNRIALELSKINSHWDDEKLFQETRHIVAAIVQQITYNEFLPMVLGKEVMERYELLGERQGMLNKYNPKLEATLPTAFFAAAFRFGHSLIPNALERWSTSHKFIGSRRLSEIINKPFDVYTGNTCDEYLTGFMNQISQAVDDSVSQELTNHLFRDETSGFGTDLASLNIQRGRDHGVPSYNAYREFCGLRRARNWNDLAGSFNNETLQKYIQTYSTPDDIDLWSAGVSERPLPGSMVGPVFGCIMGETFKNLRLGDRFWFENAGQPSSFTQDQVNEIRKVKLSRVICDNSDHIETVQVYVMVLPDAEINPRVACKSGILPRINLSKWKD
uniref:Chorion peroxidase n=1 Tax=Daphnia galeata TaxID=27404 RepID=A0A8J2WKJ7_9CRUS|nr:unnamed protein product [Daphnia galeata]